VAGELASLRPAHARVDLSRLKENYAAVRAFAGLPLIPVVKADAYGHGAMEVARYLAGLGASLMAVAFPEEGRALRKAGIGADLLVLSFGASQAELVVEEKMIPVVSTDEGLEAFLKAARGAGRTVACHVEVDTGMARLGFPSDGLERRLCRLLDSGVVDVQGIMTHLACADENAERTEGQLDLFDRCLERLDKAQIRPRIVHAAHSAGLPHVRKTHTHVRPGLLLYGLKPRPRAPQIEVRPVMSVHAGVLVVKSHAPGTPVSYGGRWVSATPSRVATLPIGYADGVPRTRGMETGGFLSRGGDRLAVAGAVCMDFMMVDVTGAEVREGDEVTLFGDEPSAWDLAGWAGTTVWQILTGVGPRLARVYVEEGQIVAVHGPTLS
jgi:alanine racemase